MISADIGDLCYESYAYVMHVPCYAASLGLRFPSLFHLGMLVSLLDAFTVCLHIASCTLTLVANCASGQSATVAVGCHTCLTFGAPLFCMSHPVDVQVFCHLVPVCCFQSCGNLLPLGLPPWGEVGKQVFHDIGKFRADGRPPQEASQPGYHMEGL